MSEQEQQEAPEDTGVEIELEGAETKDDAKESASPEPQMQDTASGDELDDYSQKVQNRIKKLTEKYRNAERDGQEAARLAQQLLEENNKLKAQVSNLDKGYVSSEEQRLQALLDGAKRTYREAYESGDTDRMFEAQQQIAQITLAQERVNNAKRRFERAAPAEEQAAPVQQPAAQQRPAQQQPTQQQPKPDPRAEEWAQKNEWFGQDEVMTYAAFGIHRKLVEDEGFDPHSDEYYSEVDRRLRAEFPHKFAQAKKSGGAQVASAAASASRSNTKSGRRSVKLSPSQIAMAKRLNVPLEEYAKYVKE